VGLVGLVGLVGQVVAQTRLAGRVVIRGKAFTHPTYVTHPT